MQQQLSIKCDFDESIANYVCITCKQNCCKKCIEQHSNNNCVYIQQEQLITFYNDQLNKTYSVQKLQDFDSNLTICREKVKYLILKLKNLEKHLKEQQIHQNINERISYRKDQEKFQENFLKDQTKENLKKMISQIICKNGQQSLREPDDDTSQANINIIEQQIQEINLVCTQFDNFFENFDANKLLNPDQYQLQLLNTTFGDSEKSNDISEIQSQISSDIDDSKGDSYNEILQIETKYSQAIQTLQHKQEQSNPKVQQEIKSEENKIKFLITFDNQDVIAATNTEIFLIQINQNQIKCSSTPRLYGQHSKNSITALSKSLPERKQEFIVALKSGFIQIWDYNNNQLNYQSMHQLSLEYGRMLIGLQIDTLVILGGDKEIKYFNLNLKKFTHKKSLKNNQLNGTPQCLYVHNNTDFIVIGGIASFIVYRDKEFVTVRGFIEQQQKIKFIGKNQKKLLYIATTNNIYVYIENKYKNYERIYVKNEIHDIRYISVFDSYILINLKEKNQNNYLCKVAEFENNQLKIKTTQNVQNIIRLCILQEQQNQKVFQIFSTQNLMIMRSQIIQ